MPEQNRACPQCRENGGDRTGDHLFLLSSGEAWFCTRCKYIEKIASNNDEDIEISTTTTINDIQQLPAAHPYRDIDTKFLDAAGIKTAMSTTNRSEISAVYYPVYSTSGELVAYKERTLPKSFKYVGSTKNTPLMFFGQMDVGTGGKLLIVVEGEDDTVMARDLLAQLGKSYNVVGLHGASYAERTARDNIQFLESFETVVFMTDQDPAGRKAAVEMSNLLSSGKAKLAKFSEKDICDLAAAGKHKEFLSALWKAKVYTPEGIVAAGDFKDSYLSQPPRVAIPLDPCFSELNGIIDGVGRGELTLVTGGTGCVPAYTEFFNGTGWKPISEYSVGDKVLQYNEDGSASLVDPLAYVKIETSDPFNRFKNTSVDMELSDEHRMVFISRKTGKLLSKSAQQVVETTETTERGYCSGGVLSTMSTTGTVDEFDERLLRLKVAVLADGSHHGLKVRINLKKSRKKDRLRKLLQGLDYSEVAKDNGYSVFTFNQSIVDKSFPDSWWSFSRKPLSVIADEAYHWDGSVKTQEFFTKDSRMFDMMQWVFTCTASTRVSSYVYDRGDGPEYTLRVSRNDSKLSCIGHHTNKRMVVTKVNPVDGYKYCFNVPSSMLILRNNNYIFVTGNSGKSQMFDQNTAYWLKQGYRVGKLAMEHNVARSIDNTLSVLLEKNLKRCREEVGEGAISEAYDKYLADNRYFLIDHSYDDATDATLIDKVRQLAVTAQCDVIIVDHLSAILYEDSAGDSGTSREDRVVRELVKIANRFHVAVVLVAHPRKTASGTKSVEAGAFLSLDDLKGSSGIKQQPDVIISAVRDSQNEDPAIKRRTEYHVLKNRYHSDTGPAGMTTFNIDTANYEPYVGEF